MELLSVSWKNMELTVFGIKLRLGVIILIVVLYWLLWGHVLCSCSRVGLLEGLINPQCQNEDGTPKKDAEGNDIVCDGPKEAADSTSTTGESNADTFIGGMKEYARTLNFDMTTFKPIEGFVGANTNYGESSKYSLTNDKPIKTSSWFTPNLTYKKGGKIGKGAQNILDRKKQQIPLPEGQLLMFANTEFKPDCCPNAYSNSMGCACMDVGQYNYLINRGGNNVPYSEY